MITGLGFFGCNSTITPSHYSGACIVGVVYCVYRGADKSLPRPGRKQATATKL